MMETGDKQPNFEAIWRVANAFEIPPHKIVKWSKIKLNRKDKLFPVFSPFAVFFHS